MAKIRFFDSVTDFYKSTCIDDRITPHFTWREMLTSRTALRLGISNLPNNGQEYVLHNLPKVCDVLEKIRSLDGNKVGQIVVSSGFRCEALNNAVHGSPTSAHLLGLAADFTSTNMPVTLLSKFIREAREHGYISYDQLIFYPRKGFIHLGLKVNPENNRNQFIINNCK